MVYEFAAKIKDIENEEMLEPEVGNAAVEELMRKNGATFEITLRHEKNSNKDMMVKGKVSVSSFSPLHERELEDAISQFKKNLEEIAVLLGGKINENEAFYNNSKTFAKLYF